MKILAIASTGGHWIQLLRLKPAFEEHEIVFASTKEDFAETVKDCSFCTVPDFNRWNKLKLFEGFIKTWKLISDVKPDIIITTGAAPGLMGVIIGRMRNIRTIWIDSIANVDTLSMSGKLATYFSDRVYTQWVHLAKDGIIFNGNVIA